MKKACLILFFCCFYLFVTNDTASAREGKHCWALLIEHGRSFSGLLTNRYGVPQWNIINLPSSKNGPLELKNVKKHLEKLSTRLTPEDILIVVSCGHARRGNVIGEADISFVNIQKKLKKIKATKVVILEVCHSGLAVWQLKKAADLIYTGCRADEKCGGPFFELFLAALGNSANAFRRADKNKDKKVTFGEAFDYAATRKLLEEKYKLLHQKNPGFWPGTHAPHPQRKKNPSGYSLSLD